MITLDWYISKTKTFYRTSYSQRLQNFQVGEKYYKTTILKFKALTGWGWFSQGVVATSQSALYQLHPSSHYFWLVADNLSPRKTMLQTGSAPLLPLKLLEQVPVWEAAAFYPASSPRERITGGHSQHTARQFPFSLFSRAKVVSKFMVNDFLRRLLKLRCVFVLCDTKTKQCCLWERC